MKIKTITGAVIYESETAENTIDLIKEALEIGAYLDGADLSGSNLCGADLRGANLRSADLRDANLSGSNLRDAYLRDADLRDANLRDANLSRAYLRGADLRDADLRDANLRDANLGGAYLRDADLSGANLSRAYLRDAKNIPYIPTTCPTDGDFTGWKKIRGFIVKLLIPADAKRSSATTSKCRCDKAKVLEITNIDETETYTKVINNNYRQTTYKVGEMVYPDSFDDDRWNECSHGIHFFIDKQEAINY